LEAAEYNGRLSDVNKILSDLYDSDGIKVRLGLVLHWYWV
jgi:hypothetical protein